MKVLVVDDDPAFRRLASLGLEEAGIRLATARNAREALELLEGDEGGSFDAILLDLEMPGSKGWEVVERLRARGNDVPVLFVSSHESSEEKVRALELGADDYLVKPFDFAELVARIHAVVRRRLRSERVKVADLVLDSGLRNAERDGKPLDLSPKEFEVLWVLIQASGRTVSRQELLKRVWGLTHDPETNLVQVHVSRLRRKLGNGEKPRIETVRGRGYRLAT